MSFLLIAQVFPPRHGGSGRWMWDLYSRISGAPVTVAAGACAGDAAFDGASGMDVTRIPLDFSSWGVMSWRSPAEHGRALSRLRELVAADRPAAVHCAKALPEGLLGLALHWTHGLPYLCFAHGEELRLAATSRELRWLTRQVLRRAAVVVANSTFTRDVLLHEWNLPDERVRVLSPGVDTSYFVPGARDRAARERLGWGDRPVILTVGAMQQRKGQDTVIAALPAIRERCPDVLYAIVGPPVERAYLEQVAREHGVADAVQFRETVTDAELVACYQQCDVFALANRQIGWDVEGFGIVLLEAQACGKPVIAGRSGGTVDTLVDNETGLLVEAALPGPVGDALVSLLTTPGLAERMGSAGREWVVQRYDWRQLSIRAAELFSVQPSPGAPDTVPVS